MDYDFSTLSILAEVNIGFVAFAAIVASLRITLGKELAPFQKLLIHFFTETGLLNLSIALLAMVLWEFWPDEPTVAWFTTIYTFTVTTLYMVYYVRRRFQIKAPMPLPSLLVMIGYAIWITVLAITLSGIYWPPSLAIITAFCLWGLFSTALIFVAFLATFVGSEGARK